MRNPHPRLHTSQFQHLEDRRLLAAGIADVASGHVPPPLSANTLPAEVAEFDANRDHRLTPIDPLLVINHLSRTDRDSSVPSEFELDLNRDGTISDVDALVAIKALVTDSSHVLVAARGEPEQQMAMGMRDPNAMSAHHLKHHQIPDFSASPTLVVSESGRWSEIASLQAVDANSVIVIAQGHNVVYDRQEVRVKSIGVYGTLAFDVSRDTELTVQELLVHGSGLLEIGSKTQPVPKGISATVTIGDRPLNTASDPTEAGNGIIVLGKIRVHGAELGETFVPLTQSPKAGDRILQVESVPSGWDIGDRIALPQTLANDDRALTEEFTIAALTANTIELDGPVSFDRPPAIDGDLVTVSRGFDGRELRGHVANLTRNVIFRSENPAANRGHFMSIGNASVDVRYASFESLGRTKIGGDDSTILADDGSVIHQGTNQIGRYSFHMHHVSGPRDGMGDVDAFDPAGLERRQFRIIGNAVTNGLKWGITIHNSHYGLVQDNVVHQVQGSGIITEEGPEAYNYIFHNFVLGLEGDGDTSRYDKFGDRGSAYWARGGHNYWVDNVAAAGEEGFGLYISNDFGNSENSTKLVRIPNFPGASTSDFGEYTEDRLRNFELLQFSGNEAYAIEQFSVGSWDYKNDNADVASPHFANTMIWNSTGTAVYLDYNSAVIDGLIIRGHEDRPTEFAIRGHNPNGPGGPTVVSEFDIQQVVHAYYDDSRPAKKIVFENGFAQNYDGFLITNETQSTDAIEYLFRNVTYAPVSGRELVAIRTEMDPNWRRGGHYIDEINHSIQILVLQNQGNPDDNFRLYFKEQGADYVIDSFAEGFAKMDFRHRSPEKFVIGGRTVAVRMPEQYVVGRTQGETNQEAWARHRSALLREVAPVDSVERDGFVGLASPIQAGVVPSTADPLPLPAFWFESDSVTGHGENVAIVYKDFDQRGADAILFQIDDGEWIRETDNDGRITLKDLSTGTHTITSAFAGKSGAPWGTRVKFAISVLGTSDQVALGDLPSVVLNADAAQQVVEIVGFDHGNAAHGYSFSVVSSNAAVVRNSRIEHVPGESSARLVFTPTGVAGQAGLHVTLRNHGADGVSGSLDDVIARSVMMVSVTGDGDVQPPMKPSGIVSFNVERREVVIPANSAEQSIAITGIDPGIHSRSFIEVISSNSRVVRRVSLDYQHGDATAELRFQPEPNRSGEAKLQLKLIDAGADGSFYTSDDVIHVEFVHVSVNEG